MDNQLNLNARTWSIYEDMKGADGAAKSMSVCLNVRIKDARHMMKMGNTKEEAAHVALHHLLRHDFRAFLNFGACDTEPESIATAVFEQVLKMDDGSLDRHHALLSIKCSRC